MSDHWIQGAINPKHKGLLHKELHVPVGDKIPHSKIVKAEHADNPAIAKRARLANTLEHLHRRHGGSV